ncbi:MAG: NADH-quinone oxidoreductase subunit C, partial [Smithellaceae bacterium]|nr:NADH-quinone oxidoreductase subunit C [Smithellaceae bacterium]
MNDLINKFGSIADLEVTEADYQARGYHYAFRATGKNIPEVIKTFDEAGFYLEDMLCVDWVERLDLVYFFFHYDHMLRVKAVLSVDPGKPVCPSCSDIFPNAYYLEREICEFFGVFFEGHRNLTYLFLHNAIDHYPLRKGRILVPPEEKARLDSYTVTEADDTFFVNMGPQHPSTHGVLRIIVKMEGEYILEAEPVLGYLHRMQEKMGENRTYAQFLPNTGRMDYLGAMSFNLGYVTAVEKLLGIVPPERAEYIRIITTELNRVSSHLLWVGAYLADLGALTPFLFVFDDREQILDILEGVTGSRLTYCYFRFGGVMNDVDEAFAEKTRAFVQRMRTERFGMYERLIAGNPIFISRTRDVGVVTRERARKYGLTGPALRSTGHAFDMRKVEPYSLYDKMEFSIPTGQARGAIDMYQIRIREMEMSLRIIEQALAALADGPVMAEKVPKKIKPPLGDVYHTVEMLWGE